MHVILQRQMSRGGLKMIRQTIVRPAKVVALIFATSAEIPFLGNQKAMVVLEILIPGIAVSEPRLLEIAAESVGGFSIKKIVRVFVLRHWGSRGLEGVLLAGEHRRNSKDQERGKRVAGNFHDEQMNLRIYRAWTPATDVFCQHVFSKHVFGHVRIGHSARARGVTAAQ